MPPFGICWPLTLTGICPLLRISVVTWEYPKIESIILLYDEGTPSINKELLVGSKGEGQNNWLDLRKSASKKGLMLNVGV